MERVKQRYMLPFALPGVSYFLFTEVSVVKNFVKAT